MLVLVKFRVMANLRFLSHAETIKLFRRACVRAGIELEYSQGFNPRPKLSLPLPRSVGVEADDELLCLRVPVRDASCVERCAKGAALEPPNIRNTIKTRLSEQLPKGCELLSVGIAKTKTSFQPTLAAYVFAVRPEYLNEKLRDTIRRLLASESLNLQRTIDAKGSTRNVDVRGFLKSIESDDGKIIVECRITSAGSIRPCEILKLLKLDYQMLAAPIRRTSVQWLKM